MYKPQFGKYRMAYKEECSTTAGELESLCEKVLRTIMKMDVG